MKIAVIGGGLGGLAAAHALVKAGHDAQVFEASTRAGGVIATSVVDGYRREHAANAFIGGPPSGGLALCNELGVPVEKASPRARTRWIFIDGKLRALPTGPLALVRSDLLTWRGKLALLREPFAPAGPDSDESVHDFAARRLGPEAARAFVAPFVTGVFAADSHDISLESGFPKLAALDAAGGLVWGGLKQIFRRPPRGALKTARGLWAPIGGVGALVGGLAAQLGARVHVGAHVGRVEQAGDGVAIDGQRWDQAVLALPAADAIPIVERALPELATKLAPFSRAPVAIVYLGIAQTALPPGALDGFGFLVAKGEDLRVLGCVFESTVWSERAPAGRALLRCIFGGGRDPGAAALSDAELIDHASRDVARALGLASPIPPEHASVVRHARGVAQYGVGHADRVREASAAARLAHIVLAGADYRGASINDLCGDALH